MPNHVDRLDAQRISLEDIRTVARTHFEAGYRFITLTVVNLGEGGLDIIYHYDKNLEMKHYRVTVPAHSTVPSISEIYFCAMLVENEARDHYGITWEGIVVDFQGHLYLEKEMPPALMRGPSCTISTASRQG